MRSKTQSTFYTFYISIEIIQSKWHTCLNDVISPLVKSYFNDGRLILSNIKLNTEPGDYILIEIVSENIHLSEALTIVRAYLDNPDIIDKYQIKYNILKDYNHEQTSSSIIQQTIGNAILDGLCDYTIDKDILITFSLYVLLGCYKTLPFHQRLIIAKDISAQYIAQAEHVNRLVIDHKYYQVTYHASKSAVNDIYMDVFSTDRSELRWLNDIEKEISTIEKNTNDKVLMTSVFQNIIDCVTHTFSFDVQSVIMINKFVYQILYEKTVNERSNLKKSVTMSVFGRYGGLGYQLFQYASLIGLSRKYNVILVLPKWVYSSYFSHPFPFGDYEKGIEVSEPSMAYYKDWKSLQLNHHVDIIGYLQSEKYWLNYKKNVLKALTIKSQIKNEVKEKYGLQKQSIAVHFDIRNNNDFAGHLPLTLSYYKEALELFSERDQIIIFCDDTDNCKPYFDGLKNIIFIQQANDIADLCIMIQCKGFILSNHPLSWWGAYLSEVNGNQIIRPFSKNDHKSVSSGYWPENWRILAVN